MSAPTATLPAIIDHTILKPDATEAEVLGFCEAAKSHAFCAVCVNPVHVALVSSALRGSDVRTCSVVAFPFGATPTDGKAAEAARAVADGAHEIDMVIAIGALKDGRLSFVLDDLEAVRASCAGALLKVIIETALLTDEQKRTACRIAREAGADFVKTSTGYASSGATAADVALMRAEVGPGMGVKASGGIRSRETAEAMIAAGATRIGTSAGIALISGGTAAVTTR